MNEIIPGLWMGGEIIPTLDTSFGAVVDCRMLEDIGWPSIDRAFLWIPFLDVPVLPANWLIEQGCQFIKIALYGGLKTLVHCTAGHNRSGLIVGSYLILGKSMTPYDAVALIRSKRGPEALSNLTFERYLMGLHA